MREARWSPSARAQSRPRAVFAVAGAVLAHVRECWLFSQQEALLPVGVAAPLEIRQTLAAGKLLPLLPALVEREGAVRKH